MKWTAFAYAAAIALALGPTTARAYDEIDDLLNVDSATREADTAQAAIESRYSAASEPDGWHPSSPMTAPAIRGNVPPASIPAAAADSKGHPAGPINAVPEPSAILLALAALVYLVIFGRRRRLV